MDQQSENREPVYVQPGDIWATPTKFAQFVVESGNANFRSTAMTWVTLAVLLIGYPGMSLIGTGQDPLALLRSLDQTMLMIMLLATIFVQWAIFLVNYLAAYTERTGLGGVGLKRIRLLDFAWAIAFLMAANLLLSGLAWLLGQLGHPMAGEVGLLIPKDPVGQVVWFFVAITAGFCEEIAFRGYIMTRIRLVFRLNSWWLPTVLSSVAFGLCHSYQGGTGLIVITVYGLLFSLLYIRTGSLWPCIIAHFFQDFSALFFPH